MSNYLKRLYPWQSLKLNWKMNKAQVSPTNVTSPLLPQVATAKAVQRLLTCIDKRSLNFTVIKRVSSIPHAGNGVYFQGQKQRKGTIICFYPGTIYMPAEPILFVSLGNQYILKCVDGLYVDGKPTGLSGKVYRSLYKRENWPGAIQISDWTWLNTDNLANPLAVGQFVNNATVDYKANVCYQEIDLPIDFPHALRRLIPNMYWDTFQNPLTTSPMRVVALVAMDDIEDGDELFATYMDIV
ncbi:uncharacterized protein EV154DRAFT_524483 [Mucor mucedo]|uniref:uncharacterized protein n=1 Tax=Mucor mucedo TaxID=29922 RepID=UPI0022203757|nr:uncharacterized protein EV154DRAFT_524483 [Mucor mucedo]KAI7879555.1 hypothetical protein EV154DRAFT_524483 [Mucor mucedo]